MALLATVRSLQRSPAIIGAGLLAVILLLVFANHLGPKVFNGEEGSRLPVTYITSGSFTEGGAPRRLGWSRPTQNLKFYASWSGDDRLQGALRTSPFVAPHDIHFLVSGYFNLAGMRLYLVDDETGRELDLSSRIDPAFDWKMHFWRIPQPWQGRKVHLVAEDHCSGPNCWLGLSEISAGPETAVFCLARAAFRTALLLYSEALFLFPGLAVCCVLVRLRGRLTLQLLIAAGVAGGGVASYCLFWTYLASPTLGKAASYIVILSSAVVVASLGREKARLDDGLARELALCLLLVTCTAIFYNAVGFLYASDEGAVEVAQVRYLPHQLPPDNALPELFAERLFNGESVRPTLFSYWHSSDRPPLETAITLMELPFSLGGRAALQYQVLGVFLQTTFIAGVWSLLRAMRVNTRTIVVTLGFCIFSQFCLLHSFYVWAKLLSATFCFTGLAFVFPHLLASRYRSGSPLTRVELVWGALCIALALLCHPGIAFTMLGISLVAAARRSVPSKISVAIAVPALVLMLLPWTAYQAFYDPPGDNLLKAHLAGVIDLKHSLSYCIVNAYRHLTLSQFITNKIENVKVLFWSPWLARITQKGVSSEVGAFLESCFFVLAFAIGFLNVGFLLRVVHRRRESRETLTADIFLAVACSSIAVWCLVMFEPGSTLVHQGSFATVLLLLLSAAIYLQSLAPNLASALLAMQAGLLFPVFVFARPLFAKADTIEDGALDLGMALTAVLAVVAMGYTGKALSGVEALVAGPDTCIGKRKGNHERSESVVSRSGQF